MKPPQRLLPYIGIVIAGFGWMVPMFTQPHQKYPCLGPIHLYGIGVGAVLGIVCSLWFFATGGHRGERRKRVTGTYLHTHLAARPDLARNVVEAARQGGV